MILEVLVDSVSIEDITCGDPDIRKAFRVGEIVRSELIVLADVENARILPPKGKVGVRRKRNIEYEITARILGGYYPGPIIPNSEEKKKLVESATGSGYVFAERRRSHETLYLAVECGVPMRMFLSVPVVYDVYESNEFAG